MKFASVVVAALMSLGFVPGAFAWDILTFSPGKKPAEVEAEKKAEKGKMDATERRAASMLRQAVNRDIARARSRNHRKENGFRKNVAKIAAVDYSKTKRAPARKFLRGKKVKK